MRYIVEKAEEGTPAVDAFLGAGYEPFAVVSEPVEVYPFRGDTVMDGRGGCHDTAVVVGHVNVIWFRRTAG